MCSITPYLCVVYCFHHCAHQSPYPTGILFSTDPLSVQVTDACGCLYVDLGELNLMPFNQVLYSLSQPPSYTSLNPQSRKNCSLSLGRLRDKWQSRNDSLSLTWNIFRGSKTHLVRAAFKRSVDLPGQTPVSLILKFFFTMGKPCLSLIQGQSVGSRLSFRVGSTVMTIRL